MDTAKESPVSKSSSAMKNFICKNPTITFGLGWPISLVLMGVAFLCVGVLAMRIKRQI